MADDLAKALLRPSPLPPMLVAEIEALYAELELSNREFILLGSLGHRDTSTDEAQADLAKIRREDERQRELAACRLATI